MYNLSLYIHNNTYTYLYIIYLRYTYVDHSYSIAQFKLNISMCILVELLEIFVEQLKSYIWVYNLRHENPSSTWVIYSLTALVCYFTCELHIMLLVKCTCIVCSLMPYNLQLQPAIVDYLIQSEIQSKYHIIIGS